MSEDDGRSALDLSSSISPTRPYPLHTANTTDTINPAAHPSSTQSNAAANRPQSTIPIIHRRRTVTSSESALLPLALDLDIIQESFHPPSHSYHHTRISSSNLPTASIAIPPPKSQHDRPITPLSGRPKNLSAFESIEFDTSRIRGYSSSSTSPASSDMSSSPSRRQPARPIVIDPRRRQAEPLSYGHMSSPLSPNLTTSHPLQERQQRARRPQHNLNLAGLPKFHPANFHNVDPSKPTLSPQSSRHASAGSGRRRHGSDAQQRLHQYQRDAVASYTKHILSPKSPRLGPQESPGTRITPLALENAGDYLSAGSTVASPPQNAASARVFVDKLIQKENLGRAHPEARSGSASPAYSPSVSPAVSPAGGGFR